MDHVFWTTNNALGLGHKAVSQTNRKKMKNVGGNRGFGFVWQEAIGGLGDGKDVGMKLYILKLNLAAGDMDWSRKG